MLNRVINVWRGNEVKVKAKVTSTALLLKKQKIPFGYTTPKILGTSNWAVVADSFSFTTAALICSHCYCSYTHIEHIIRAIYSVRKRAAHQCHLALQHCHPTVGFKGFSEVLCHIILQWNEIHSTHFTVKQGRKV